jgi:hypothetical protein
MVTGSSAFIERGSQPDRCKLLAAAAHRSVWKAHVGIDLRIMIANTEQVAEAVHRGDADLGFVEGKVDDLCWPFENGRRYARSW